MVRRHAIIAVILLFALYFFPQTYLTQHLQALIPNIPQCYVSNPDPKSANLCISVSDELTVSVLRMGFIPTFGSSLANMLPFQWLIFLAAAVFIILGGFESSKKQLGAEVLVDE